MNGEEDEENWYTEETGFKTTWTMYRWLPKYEFIVDYYKNNYRFSPDTNDVKAWAYSSTNGETFKLTVQNNGDFIKLAEANGLLAVLATGIAAAAMISF